MLFLLFAFLFFLSTIFISISWLNNFICKKIHKKNLKILEVIDKCQYNSPIFFAIKIINTKNIYFNEINSWLKRYFNLFGNNLQMIINEYNIINTKKKYFFVLVFLLISINKKILKLKNDIIQLNNDIRKKLNIKEIEDEYKVNLSKKFTNIKNHFDEYLILYPEIYDNENYKLLVNKINDSIMLVDEKIDNGEFCLSAKTLINLSTLISDFLDIINLYPIIFKIIKKEIIPKIQKIKLLSLFDKYNPKCDYFNNKFNLFEKNILNNIDDIFLMLKDLKYNSAIEKLNNSISILNKTSSEFEMINKIIIKYVGENSIVIKNINYLFDFLRNLVINSALYLGEYNNLSDSEQLILKKAQKTFEEWNDEISKTLKLNQKAFSLKEYLNLLNKINKLIDRSLANSIHIKKLNEVYNSHKKDINNITSKIFNLKNNLNNLLRWLNKFNSLDLKNLFFDNIQTYFKRIDNIKVKDLYPAHKLKIKEINDELLLVDKLIIKLENNIKDFILFDKLTEELIVYNNKYLIHKPELYETLSESKKAYDQNDNDLSFRISLSILNSIKKEEFN